MKKLLAAWLCGALVACAMGGKKAAAPQMPSAAQTGAPEPTTPEEKRAAITKLSDDIATQQRNQQAHVPPAPTPMSAGSQTCTDVCTIKGTICGNAKQICKLADELQPDEWATGKCNDANKSCDDATKRCTDCGA